MVSKLRQKDVVGKRVRMVSSVYSKKGHALHPGEICVVGSSVRKWRFGLTSESTGVFIHGVEFREFEIVESGNR